MEAIEADPSLTIQDLAAMVNLSGSRLSHLFKATSGFSLQTSLSNCRLQFRTAPLWGLGQRIFFLHDGRTRDLVQAIENHFSNGNHQYPSSEANGVVNGYNRLSPSDQQDLLNFLRSL